MNSVEQLSQLFPRCVSISVWFGFNHLHEEAGGTE